MRVEWSEVWGDVSMGKFAAEFALQPVQRRWTVARRNHDDFGSEPVLVGIEPNGESRHLDGFDGAQRGGLRIGHVSHECERDVVILARYTARTIPECERGGSGCDQTPRLSIGKGREEQAHGAARS
jgi:hypothetical protein